MYILVIRGLLQIYKIIIRKIKVLKIQDDHQNGFFKWKIAVLDLNVGSARL